MVETETAKPKVFCVCTHPIEGHGEFTDKCPKCACSRPRPEAKPRRLL